MSFMDRLASLFGRRPAAEISNAVVTSSDYDGMMSIFAPISGPANEPVTDITAMRVSTVYACLTKIAGTVTQLPVHQYRLDDNGDRQKIPPSPLWWFLNESPTDAWTAASWKEWIVRCMFLRGDQFTQILRRGATIIGFMPLHPDRVQVSADQKTGRLHYYVMPLTGAAYGVDQDDMLHFTGFGFNGTRSLSVIQHAAFHAIGNALSAAKYMGRTVAEGGLPQIALKYPNKFDQKQADALRESFQKAYGNQQGRKLPLVLSEGGEAQVLSIDPIDIELMAQRQFEREDICQAFGVPPVLIGDNSKTSSWGTGIEQITLGFVRFTITPLLARWEEELNRKIFRRAGQFLEFSLAALLRGDSAAQAVAFRAALGGPGTGDGWMSLNEVRKLQNLPPVPDGDIPYRAPAKPAPTSPGATA